MSQNVDTNFGTFIAGAAIGRFLRVKLSSGKLAAAGIADKEIGTLEEDATGDLHVVRVRLRTATGTRKMIAAAAITAGADCFTAAAGKVSVSASTAFLLGSALEAAAADGDIIEVLPHQLVGAAVV